MKKRKYLIMVISVLVLCMTANSGWALFGLSKTTTEFGNAKMELPNTKVLSMLLELWNLQMSQVGEGSGN